MLKDLPMMPDLLSFDRPKKKMKQHVAPIALFAVDPQKVLRVVAIQNTSSSGDLSKLQLHVIHFYSYAEVDF